MDRSRKATELDDNLLKYVRQELLTIYLFDNDTVYKQSTIDN